MEDYLNLKQAADYINIHYDTLRAWIKSNFITPDAIRGRRPEYFFKKETCERKKILVSKNKDI